MDCLLHIGTDKTGTTSIQEFLHLNRQRLGRRGILFTRSCGEINNHFLAVAAYDLGHRDDLTANLSLRTNHDLEVYQQLLQARLHRELREAGTPRVVFSSEHLQSRLKEVPQITRLRRFLSDAGIRKTKVIVYLRDPADLAFSLHSTSVKGGHPGTGPCSPDSDDGTGYDPAYFRNVCDHRATIQRWGGVFGMENIIPRLFRRDQFVQGDLLRDFIATAQLPALPYDFPKPHNEALDHLGLELMRRFNAHVSAFVDGTPNPLRGQVWSLFEKYFTSGERQPQSLQIRQAYEVAFAEGNEWVRQRFFPELPALFEPRPAGPDATHFLPPGQWLDQCAAMVAELWLEVRKNALKNREEELAPSRILPISLGRVRRTVSSMLRKVGVLPKSRAA
ncbi:MAG: hypothetical protein ACKOS8_04440 [Gemmataceae bacterium]